MAVGDDCPVDIPCMPRRKANRYNFLRWRKPQNWTYTELKNNGLSSLKPCSEVEFGTYIIVLEFQTDYQTYQDGSGNDQLFSPTLDVLDNSETPKWKTTDDNVDNIDAETPDWDFPNSDDKFVICCMKAPASGLPKVDLLFEGNSDSYIKGLIDISVLPDIGKADFSSNGQLTGIEFGSKDRYLDEITAASCSIDGTLDFKNTTAKIISAGSNNFTAVSLKQSSEKVNQINLRSGSLESVDFTGVNLINAIINISNSPGGGDVVFESGQEIKEFNMSGSGYNSVNFEEITIVQNGNYDFASSGISSISMPSKPSGVSQITSLRISFNGINTAPNFSPLSGLDITDILQARGNNYSIIDFSPLGTIDTLLAGGNPYDPQGITLPSEVTSVFKARDNPNLNQVFPYGASKTIKATTFNVSHSGLPQANVDAQLKEVYDDPISNITMNVSNDAGGSNNSNEAPSGLDSNGDVPTSPTAGTGAEYIRDLVDNHGATITYWDDVNNINKTIS